RESSLVNGGERRIGGEGCAGGFDERDLASAKEAVDFVALVDGDEEDLARAGAPLCEEAVVGEEIAVHVGEGAAEEHGGGAAVDEQHGIRERAVEVIADGGAEGLVAVEQDGGVGIDL